MEVLGFLVFDRIGVTTTGYHDDDEDDLAITVYPRGAWNKFLKKGVAPDLSRYEQGESSPPNFGIRCLWHGGSGLRCR